MPVKPAIIPGLRYRDAPAAIDFLCRAFGFERQAVYPDPADPHIIAHAQLVLDGNMIMLGTHRDGEGQALYGWKTPQQAGGVTSSLYVVIDDVAAHFERAKAGGADLIDEVHDNVGYPGQGYSARDWRGGMSGVSGRTIRLRYKEASRFLKRTKKLLLPGHVGPNHTHPGIKSSLVLFFKKGLLSWLPPPS